MSTNTLNSTRLLTASALNAADDQQQQQSNITSSSRSLNSVAHLQLHLRWLRLRLPKLADGRFSFLLLFLVLFFSNYLFVRRSPVVGQRRRLIKVQLQQQQKKHQFMRLREEKIEAKKEASARSAPKLSLHDLSPSEETFFLSLSFCSLLLFFLLPTCASVATGLSFFAHTTNRRENKKEKNCSREQKKSGRRFLILCSTRAKATKWENPGAIKRLLVVVVDFCAGGTKGTATSVRLLGQFEQKKVSYSFIFLSLKSVCVFN